MIETDSSTLLADVAVIALVVAHGTDADLDTRESRAVVERLTDLSETLTSRRVGVGALAQQVELAVSRYGRLTVPTFEALVADAGRRLNVDGRSAAFAVLVDVAEADGVVHTMEQTLLRHIAQAWGVTALG